MAPLGEAGQHVGLDARPAGGRPHAARRPPEGPPRLARFAARCGAFSILLEFGDFPMMRKLLLGVRQRAERSVLR